MNNQSPDNTPREHDSTGKIDNENNVGLHITATTEPDAIAIDTTPLDPLYAVKALMEIFADLNRQLIEIEQDRAATIAEQIPPEILVALAAIEAKFNASASQVAAALEANKRAIQNAIRPLGYSLEHGGVVATFRRGSTSWNTDKLLGYAKGGHPEIMEFSIQSAPTVAVTMKKS